MKVFWENDLIWDTKDRHGKLKELYFYENLEIFRYNEVLKGQKFYNVFAKSDDSVLIYSMTNEDESIEWRQIEGIKSKEEFITLVNLVNEIGQYKCFRWSTIKYSAASIMFKCLKRLLAIETPYCKFKKNQSDVYFSGVCYWNTWHENEELYNALMSSYKAGYLFNECDEDKIYSNTYIYDFTAFHEALLYYKDFPQKFTKISPSTNLNNITNFYGNFDIKIREHNDYLFSFGKMYNQEVGRLSGWFNDIDFSFIEQLCGIKDYSIKTLYSYKSGRLSDNMRGALAYCFNLRESYAGLEKQIIKLGYEKFCGEAGRRRFYPSHLEYDEDNQSFYDEEGRKNKVYQEYSFEEMDNDINNHGLDLAWNVWVNSYAREIILSLKKITNAYYGDTDSVMGNKEIKSYYLSEEHKKNCENGFLLGRLKLEAKANQFKVISKKWYAYNTDTDTIVKCSGADNNIIKDYIGKDLSKFTKSFPLGINPYKYVRINANGEKEYAWRGEENEDRTLTNDKRCIISCAGSGKTTTLIEAVKEKFNSTNEPICVIAFTNKNVDELRERIGINDSRLEIRTLDSLAASFLDGQVSGEHFDVKLKAATDILCQGYNVPPCHLFVDEFQDLDLTKYNFINAIPCISRFYIGDPNQSIYGYSGAMDLFDRLKGFKIERRSINYRCAQNINDYGEGFLEEEKRPLAVSSNEREGIIMWSTEIPDDDSVILCRTNEQVDKVKEDNPNRIVMTIHKSKGLTFDKVSIVGIDKRNSEEEANIAYVACTRAKEKLTIILEG